MDFWEQKKSFSKKIFPYHLRNLHGLKTEEENASAVHKKTEKR